jgi:hypothetical protein
MRWMMFVMSAAIALGLWLPGEAAQPAPASGGADKITFAQYRDWRNTFNERRRGELARQLSAANVPAGQKARLEQVKAYYDWLAGLSAAERDRRYRERFDLIDTDHDGAIDAAERTAWRGKQRAFYRRAAARPATGEAPAEPAAPAAAATR